MDYEVLSPWARVDTIKAKALRPRVKDLNGKTIGMYAHFKEQATVVLQELELQLKQMFPAAKFKHYKYPVDTAEVVDDVKYKASFKEWLREVDTVVSSWGDAGSCSMYLAYNTANIENLGKPAVMLVAENFINQARRGAAARQVPRLRLVRLNIETTVELSDTTENVLRPAVAAILDDIIHALTSPLTGEEKNPPNKVKETSRIVFKGNIKEVNTFFYRNGWTNGMPIIPPTEEAVEEMLMGTDLPPDYVVAKIPPMLGNATVEKIAINAVMAGCLPTYMPILIAAVKGMVDTKIHLEGWTCSMASFAPLMIITGSVSRDLHVNSGKNLMSPYYKANATIAHAFGLMIMNISGVRPGIEDGSRMGHEDRFGMCIAENQEASPWEPLHTDYGLKKEDSAVTLFWPTQRQGHWGRESSKDAAGILTSLCNVLAVGFDPGCAYVLGPAEAKVLADDGWSRKDVISYIVEYSRRPASETPVQWLIRNHHLPKEVALPVNPTHSARQFFSSDHLLIVVAGDGSIAFVGGGDHGGPSCTKIQLPANWDELVNRYKSIVPTYVWY